MSLITTPTVLILGAGASAPYGFPIGSYLRELIVRDFATPSTLFDTVKEFHNQNDIIEFGLAFKRSLLYSIDAFLRHNPKFMDVGKAAIAAVLLGYEQQELLYTRPPSNQTLRFLGLPWYEFLVSRLTQVDRDEFSNHQLTIITFNYDRSLDYALLNAISNTYGCTPALAADMLRRLPIIHIHGCLGYLPELGDDKIVKYGRGLTVENVKTAAQCIQIIHESQRDKKLLGRARNAIKDAARIIFLGFGFDQNNMKLLGLDGSIPLSSKRIQGSAFGLTAEEFNAAYRFLGLHENSPYSRTSNPWADFDCLGALRNNKPL